VAGDTPGRGCPGRADAVHLVLVENIRFEQPRIIDIHGEQLAKLLDRRREKHYFEVPFPTGTYDALLQSEQP